MRKLIAIVVALAVGVGSGLGSSELWVRAHVLPYCKVATNAEAYHMKFIRVKAKLHFTSSGTYIHENCDPTEALMSAVFLEGSDQPNFGLRYENESLVTNSSRPKTADAIIEGEFNAEASNGCWAPKFRILASKVELVSPVEDFVPAD
jgi:hypothetical protein